MALLIISLNVDVPALVRQYLIIVIEIYHTGWFVERPLSRHVQSSGRHGYIRDIETGDHVPVSHVREPLHVHQRRTDVLPIDGCLP